MRWLVLILCLTGITGCSHREASLPIPGKLVTLESSDKTKVAAYLSKAKDPQGIILLFHQAGSSAQEYTPIVPTLNGMGWDTLAVDLRSGGDLYGSNQTVKWKGQSSDYLTAYLDMEAALKYAMDAKYKSIVVWGSSYSASLVGKLASEHSGISKVIAFSPGEYFDDKTIVHKWYLEANVPIIAIWASGEKESVLKLTEGTNTIVIGSEDYIHGASTLRPDKNGKHLDTLWQQIKQFLANR